MVFLNIHKKTGKFMRDIILKTELRMLQKKKN